jgi:L-ascorbate metabolism protein UlaG (beta-lactamase superfamily)
MASLTWHGHSCFTLVTDEGSTIMFDPFLDENPAANIRKKDVTRLDYILCSHGHGDHFMDAIPLAQRTGATIVGVYELVSFAAKKGATKGQGMNVGGGAEFPFGYVKLTPALHSGSVHGDDDGVFTTQAAGFWIDLKPAHGEKGGKRLYHAGDTALMMDMQLLKGQVDLALLPIGDVYTMGPEDAARAVEFIEPKVVIPMHYNTWPPIAQDPHAFAKRVEKRARVHVLEPGQSYDF